MFDNFEGGQRAAIVHVNFPLGTVEREDVEECKELVYSAGAEVVTVLQSTRQRPDPKYFIGSGKVEKLVSAIEDHEIEIIIFNHALSPAQQRNLERSLQLRVIDRTGLILDIFAQRAQTYEGKLQVELAQLRYLSTRLIRGWTHLERQKGGIGLRGPGETQLETDRRLIRLRIQYIQQRLEKVSRQRQQGRQNRQRHETPTISLVGYTNAGKSSLFNALTDASVYAHDQLFATLDPTLRQVAIPGVANVILADTVGFIRHLPHTLVAAFRSTLEQTRQSALVLHVVDAASDEWERNIESVQQVLSEIEADSVPQLLIMNKIDLLPQAQPRIEYESGSKPTRVWCSAKSGVGLDLLREAVAMLLRYDRVQRQLVLSPNQGELRAALYRHKAINNEEVDDKGNWVLDIDLERDVWEYLRSYHVPK